MLLISLATTQLASLDVLHLSLPNPNPSRGGLSQQQQQQSPALYLPLPPYRSQPSQLTPITRRNWHVPRATPYFTRSRADQ
jgi:hypothetical protein